MVTNKMETASAERAVMFPEPVDAATYMKACYLAIARSHVPEFAPGEWVLLSEGCKGLIQSIASDGLAMADYALNGEGLSHGVQDAIRLEHLDERLGVDGPALMAKLENLDALGRLSLLDVIIRHQATVASAGDHLDFGAEHWDRLVGKTGN